MSAASGAQSTQLGDFPNDGDESDESFGRRGKEKRDRSQGMAQEATDSDSDEAENSGNEHCNISREQRRLEVNRVKARERRKKKKDMWHDMQQRLVDLTQENKELRRRNEFLAAELSRVNGRRETGQLEGLAGQLLTVPQPEQNTLQNSGTSQTQYYQLPDEHVLSSSQANHPSVFPLTSESLRIANAMASGSVAGAASLGTIERAFESNVAQVPASIQMQSANLANIGLGNGNINAQASGNLQTLLNSLHAGQQQHAPALEAQRSVQTANDERNTEALRNVLQRQQLIQLLQQCSSGSQLGQRSDEKTGDR